MSTTLNKPSEHRKILAASAASLLLAGCPGTGLIPNPVSGANTSGQFTVSASGDGHVTIAAPTSVSVSYAQSATFTVTANSGFARSSTVGGTCAKGFWSGSVYTTGAITADCSVTFSSATTTYTVTPSITHASASPSTAQIVAAGGTLAFTATPAATYSIVMVSGSCPLGSWSNGTYTTGAINASCTIAFNGAQDVVIYPTTNNVNGSAIGNRAASTPTCQSDAPTGNVACSNFKALLAYSAGDDVSNMAATYSIPTTPPVVSSKGTTIFTSWADVVTPSALSTSLSALLASGTRVWTGFQNGGTLPGTGNCTDWSAAGTAAGAITSNASWSSQSLTCQTDSLQYLCVCW